MFANGNCNPHYPMGEMQLNWKLNVHPMSHTAGPACARLAKDEQPFAALTFNMCAACFLDPFLSLLFLDMRGQPC